MKKRQCVVCRVAFEAELDEMWCSEECHEEIKNRARESTIVEHEIREQNASFIRGVEFGKTEAEKAREAISMVGDGEIELFSKQAAEHNDRLYTSAVAILTAVAEVSIAEHARTMLRLARECIEELETSFDVRVPDFRPPNVLPEGDDPGEEET
jgi:hypothetical protein